MFIRLLPIVSLQFCKFFAQINCIYFPYHEENDCLGLYCDMMAESRTSEVRINVHC
jgi:Zn-finger protein